MIHLDFETFSEAPLRTCGAYRYSIDETTEILCACYAIGEKAVQTWVPWISEDEAWLHDLPEDWHYGEEVPADLYEAVASGQIIVAHNAQFERFIWQNVVVKRHGGPRTKRAQFVCTAARSAAAGLPRGLDGSGNALGVAQVKDVENSKMLKIFAMVRKPTKKDPRKRIHPLEDTFNFVKLVKYCQQDVRAERDIDAVLPALHPFEERVFQFDMEINERGLLIDVPLVLKASSVLAKLEADIAARVKELTICEKYPEGLRATQRDKMLEFFISTGVRLENMKADHVRKYMKENKDTLSVVAKELLLLRMEASKASTKKLVSMRAYTGPDMRARGTLLYYGAHTGRWCLEKGTLLRVKSADDKISYRKIENLRLADMLWDGTEWVTHEGVMQSGIKDIIEHDGIRASADHQVWVSENKKESLGTVFAKDGRVLRSVPWAVYLLTFPNGKQYVGISSRPKRRFSDHCKALTNSAVANAVRKHGVPEFEIVEWVSGKEAAQKLEQELIEKLGTFKHGYNLTIGGEVGPGFSEEVQRAASIKGVARLQELRLDPVFSAKLNAAVSAGIRKSEVFLEATRATGAARKGQPSKNPDAARANFAKATAVRVQLSKDKRELGLLKKQKKPTPAHIKNARIGKTLKERFAGLSLEERKALTASARSVPWTEERRNYQKQVMSIAIKKYWEGKRNAK